MGDANLNIKVSADVIQAMKGFASLENAIQATQNDIENISRAIDRAETKGAVEEVKKLEAEFDATVVKLKLLKAELLGPVPGPAIAPAVSAGLKDIPVETAAAARGVEDLSSTIKNTAPAGDVAKKSFLGLGLSSSQLKIAFLDLGRVITGQGFSLRSLASNFALLGPGVAIGAAALYGLYEVFTRQTDAQKKAIETNKEYIASAAEAGKSVGDQAAKATTLVNALNSGTLNTQQRKKALKELTEINVEYFGSLKDEKGIVEGLSAAYDAYIKNLNQLGVAKAIEGQLEKLFAKKLELQLEIDPKFNTAVSPALQTELGKLKKQLQDLGGPVDVTTGSQRNVLDDLNNKELQQRISLQNRINEIEQGSIFLKDKGYQQTKKQIDLIDLQIKGLSQLQQDNGVFDIKDGTVTKIKDTSKQYDELLRKIRDAQKELDTPDKRPIFQQQAQAKLPDDFNGVSLLKQQIADAIAEGTKLGTERATTLVKELGNLYEKEIARIKFPNLLASVNFTLANPADASKQSDKLESEVEKQFGKPIKVEVPIDQKIRIESSGFDDRDQKILLAKLEKDALLNLPAVKWTPKIQAIIDAKTLQDETLKELNKAISGIEKGIATSALADIGTALGDALSGKGFSKAIASFENTLGEGLIEIGKQLILASTIIQGIKSALGQLFTDPVIGIVAGIGAIAVGEILKNSVSSVGAHAFATGGIVTGPTLGLVGEAGPEAIFPLSQLNRFIKNTQGSGTNNVAVTGRIAGNDLRLVLARANKNQSLV